MTTATATRPDLYTTVRDALRLLGYREGVPPSARPDTAAIDSAMCAHADCPACGRVGLLFHPWHVPPTCYRVVGECPECGSCAEF